MVLNYKGIPHETAWITHSEIPIKFKELGIPPNEAGKGLPYTVPVIRIPHSHDEGGEYIMESAVIAQKLESLYPERNLHLDNGLHEQAAAIRMKLARPMIPAFMPRIARDLVTLDSQEYFYKSREAMLGMPLEQAERERGGEQAWKAAEPGIKELGDFLKAHKKDEGPFVLGSEVCYADFVVASLFETLSRIGKDIHEKLMSYDENFVKLHEACKPWMEKDE